MSWLTGGSQPAAPAPNVGPSIIDAAKTEMEMTTDLFNKMADMCFNKCISKKYKDGELNVGEMSCTDRCVHKYLDAAQKVGVKLNEINQGVQAQQEMAAGMQGGFR